MQLLENSTAGNKLHDFFINSLSFCAQPGVAYNFYDSRLKVVCAVADFSLFNNDIILVYTLQMFVKPGSRRCIFLCSIICFSVTLSGSLFLTLEAIS